MSCIAEAGGVLPVPLQEERGPRVGTDSRVEERQGRLLAEDQEAVVDHPVRMSIRLLRPLAFDQRLIAGTLFRLACRLMPGPEDGDDPERNDEPQQEQDVAILAHRTYLSPPNE